MPISAFLSWGPYSPDVIACCAGTNRWKFNLSTILVKDPKTGRGCPVMWIIHSDAASCTMRLIFDCVVKRMDEGLPPAQQEADEPGAEAVPAAAEGPGPAAHSERAERSGGASGSGASASAPAAGYRWAPKLVLIDDSKGEAAGFDESALPARGCKIGLCSFHVAKAWVQAAINKARSLPPAS